MQIKKTTHVCRSGLSAATRAYVLGGLVHDLQGALDEGDVTLAEMLIADVQTHAADLATAKRVA